MYDYLRLSSSKVLQLTMWGIKYLNKQDKGDDQTPLRLRGYR